MRLIDADAVMEGINRLWEANPSENAYTDFGQALDSVSEIVEDAPTIDAAPVVHGRWVGTYGATCNLCGYIDVAAYVGRKPNYCPSCGAKMDGGIHADQDAAKTAALGSQNGKESCDCKAFWGGPDCRMDKEVRP